MIRTALLFCSILLSSLLLKAQTPYFQQDVHYDINVQLNDQEHSLTGDWALTYTNNSPDELSFIYMHLWPNAYSAPTTAFATQQLQMDYEGFYFAADSLRGYIDSLSFKSNGTQLQLEATDMGPDVVKIILDQALKPGQTTKLTTPFRVVLPASYSRLGHVKQSYQLTQWYPKPAVYDRDGWHPMPYLDFGEFYSEFGSFDVNISLPSNYVVASTGTLEDEAEKQWLLDKAAAAKAKKWSEDDAEVFERPAFPESDSSTKTLHYHADQVHDFAWFADKRFMVDHDTIQMKSGRVVDAWSFYTERQAHYWDEDAVDYIKRATHYYSDAIGEYPYPQVTALQSALSAGGGMEYPMITVIGLTQSPQALDEVITHEVGHNWFYGILGSNERTHAWMDEGFNSYYDHRYTRDFYEEKPALPSMLSGDPKMNLDELGYRHFACRHMLKAPDTDAIEMEGYNYWLGAYSIPAVSIRQMEDHIGRDKIDQAFRAYYDEWQFKHPQPADVQRSFEATLGMSLDWLFKDIFEDSKGHDYAICKLEKGAAKNAVVIKNKGAARAPFLLQTELENGEKSTQSIAGFEGEQRIDLTQGEYKKISIDPDHHSLDIRRHNNQWQKGWGKLEPLQLRLLAGVKDERYSNLFLLPAFAFNEYDGIQLGVGLHNRGMFPQALEYIVMPMYATSSKQLNGIAAARYRIWPQKQKLHEINLFASYQRFSRFELEDFDEHLAYQRFSPGISVLLPAKKRWHNKLQFRSIWINEETAAFGPDGAFTGKENQDHLFHELSLDMDYRWVLSPTRINVAIEQANFVDAFGRDQDHLKLRLEAKGKIAYDAYTYFHWRVFAGYFIDNDFKDSNFTPATAFNLFDYGAADYRYDNFYFGRNEQDGFASQQLGQRAGGFHAPVSSSFPVGRSNEFMFSVNLKADVPFAPKWLPIKPFVDAASFSDAQENKFLWNGGLALEFLGGKMGVYAPLFGSEEIMDRLKEQGDFVERLSFRFLIRDLAPWDQLDKLTNL